MELVNGCWERTAGFLSSFFSLSSFPLISLSLPLSVHKNAFCLLLSTSLSPSPSFPPSPAEPALASWSPHHVVRRLFRPRLILGRGLLQHNVQRVRHLGRRRHGSRAVGNRQEREGDGRNSGRQGHRDETRATRERGLLSASLTLQAADERAHLFCYGLCYLSDGP